MKHRGKDKRPVCASTRVRRLQQIVLGLLALCAVRTASAEEIMGTDPASPGRFQLEQRFGYVTTFNPPQMQGGRRVPQRDLHGRLQLRADRALWPGRALRAPLRLRGDPLPVPAGVPGWGVPGAGVLRGQRLHDGRGLPLRHVPGLHGSVRGGDVVPLGPGLPAGDVRAAGVRSGPAVSGARGLSRRPLRGTAASRGPGTGACGGPARHQGPREHQRSGRLHAPRPHAHAAARRVLTQQPERQSSAAETNALA